jgi:hypothetical protein
LFFCKKGGRQGERKGGNAKGERKGGTQGTLFEKASLEPRKAMPKTVVFGGIFENNNQMIVK